MKKPENIDKKNEIFYQNLTMFFCSWEENLCILMTWQLKRNKKQTLKKYEKNEQAMTDTHVCDFDSELKKNVVMKTKQLQIDVYSITKWILFYYNDIV